MNSNNIEVGVAREVNNPNKKENDAPVYEFKVLTAAQIKEYLDELN